MRYEFTEDYENRKNNLIAIEINNELNIGFFSEYEKDIGYELRLCLKKIKKEKLSILIQHISPDNLFSTKRSYMNDTLYSKARKICLEKAIIKLKGEYK